MELMERHWIGQTNAICARYCFNNRKQESGESFDTYFTALRSLRTLAKTCNFGLLTDEVIRDRLWNLRYRNQKEIIQERNLTLQECTDV